MSNWASHTSSVDYHDLFVRVYGLMIGLSFGLGAVILSGGPRRFNNPTFEGPRDLVAWLPLMPPYAWWGVMFLVYGTVLAVCIGRMVAVHVLRFGIVVFAFLTIAFLSSVLQSPVAVMTGVVAYLVFALLFAVLQDHLSASGWKV